MRNIETPTFAIRDDDLNYFSSPQDILWWYRDVFAEDIPVGFAAVPFVKPISDVYPWDLPYEDKEYPISNNHELLTYVEKNPLVHILQHGCTHETKDGVFEYLAQEGLFEKTKRGKEELEKAFKRKVTIFVAPHDSINTHGVCAVEACGMDIIRSRGSKTFLPRKEYILGLAKMVAHKLSHPIKSTMPAYPHVLDFGAHKEAYSYRLENANIDFLKRSLEYAHRKNGHYVLVNHVHHRDERRRENILETIRYAKELGFSFHPPQDLFA